MRAASVTAGRVAEGISRDKHLDGASAPRRRPGSSSLAGGKLGPAFAGNKGFIPIETGTRIGLNSGERE